MKRKSCSFHRSAPRAVIALSLLLGAIATAPAQTADTLDAALRRATAERGMVLALVTADSWCDPCNWFEENTMTAPQVQVELRTHWVFVRISDIDPTAARWEVERLPAVFLLDDAGRTVGHLYGAVTADTLVREMTAAWTANTAAAGSSADSGATAGASGSTSGAGTPVAGNDAPAGVAVPDVDRAGVTYRLLPGTGTISKRRDGRWVTTDAGLPPQLEEYDRDEAFLYLQDESSGTILALTVAPDAPTSLWRWDTGERSWVEVGSLEALR